MAALERMLVMCESTGLRLHPDKCKFGMKTVNFLGHKVGGGGNAVTVAQELRTFSVAR